MIDRILREQIKVRYVVFKRGRNTLVPYGEYTSFSEAKKIVKKHITDPDMTDDEVVVLKTMLHINNGLIAGGIAASLLLLSWFVL